MKTKIFISYRREESRYQARLMYEALRKVVPRENVFMDIESISPGADFVKVLQGHISECDILLALIGPDWFSVADRETGRRRLDDPWDFVRIEIREALRRGIPVVPVLLDGAPMPEPTLLPDDLKDLSRRQAELVEFRTFTFDLDRLVHKLGLATKTTHQTDIVELSVNSSTSIPYASDRMTLLDYIKLAEEKYHWKISGDHNLEAVDLMDSLQQAGIDESVPFFGRFNAGGYRFQIEEVKITPIPSRHWHNFEFDWTSVLKAVENVDTATYNLHQKNRYDGGYVDIHLGRSAAIAWLETTAKSFKGRRDKAEQKRRQR